MDSTDDLLGLMDSGNEECFDYTCGVCENEGKYNEATKYCTECHSFLCQTCVRNIHQNLRTKHRLLDQTQFTKMSTERCKQHPEELMSVFCGDHDLVCCDVCHDNEHRNCVNTKQLSEAAKDIETSMEYQALKKETRAMISDIEKVLRDRELDISRLTEDKRRITDDIDAFRKRINNYFDQLEKNALDELSWEEKKILGDVERDTKFLKHTLTEAERILEHLESIKEDNECDMFVHLKAGARLISDVTEKILDISKLVNSDSIRFSLAEDIEEYVKSLNSLGTFAVTGQEWSEIDSGPSFTASIKQDHTDKYEAQFLGEYSVKEASDVQLCTIYDICQLSDGIILITDYNNMKLKRLDEAYNVVDSVQFTCQPVGVCAVDNNGAAVSLCDDKKIQLLVLIGNKLQLNGSFSVGNFCRGLAYTDNKLFVCCGSLSDISSGCIKVYNIKGDLQYSIPSEPHHLPTVPLYITLGQDGAFLIVSSMFGDNVIILDLSGKTIKTFKHKDLSVVQGVCTDSGSEIFISEFNNSTIMQISTKSELKEVILGQPDGIRNPRGVCYDKIHSRLLVSCNVSNVILVFLLK